MRSPGGAWRGPVAGLRDVAEFLGDEDRAAVFLRGLTLGALVGAAIAGSQLWRRRASTAARANEEAASGDDASEDDASEDDASEDDASEDGAHEGDQAKR